MKGVEVEGGEIGLKNSHGDIVIIPKNKANWVKQKLSEGCHGCIDSLVESLPSMKDYAEDGGILPSWEKVKSTLNPYNWGVDDYSSEKDFGTAFNKARAAGEKEFMWKGERKSTDMKGTVAKQLKWSGITNDRLGVKSKISDRTYNTIKPSIYGDENFSGNTMNFIEGNNRFKDNSEEYSKIIKEYLEESEKPYVNRDEDKMTELKTKIDKLDNKDTQGEDDPYSEDAWKIYLGKPQTKNTFGISKYKPTKSKEKNASYYSLPDEFKEELYKKLKENKFDIGSGAMSEFNFEGVFGENKSRARVLGNFTVDKGVDDRGNYFSYYDNYDLSPKLPIIGKTKIENIVGKPFEIYDRIYTKEYSDGKNKRMYYSDDELKNLDANKKDFDTLALQRELNNRGVKLTNSTTKEGKFDGIYGDETKNALLEYQETVNIKNNEL